MTPPVDTTLFQLGAEPDQSAEEQAEEAPLLQALAEEALAYIKARSWAPPIKDVLLAYGIGSILGLYLVRFTRPLSYGDTERWVVVGDLPSMNFETEDTPTPALALRLYCAIAQDWADNVLSGADLSGSYPIPVPPVKENAEALLSRVEFIRNELIPLAERHGRTPERQPAV